MDETDTSVHSALKSRVILAQAALKEAQFAYDEAIKALRSWNNQYEYRDRCKATVYDRDGGFGSHRCTRKNGHGRNGAYCKQHGEQGRYAEYQVEATPEKEAEDR